MRERDVFKTIAEYQHLLLTKEADPNRLSQFLSLLGPELGAGQVLLCKCKQVEKSHLLFPLCQPASVSAALARDAKVAVGILGSPIGEAQTSHRWYEVLPLAEHDTVVQDACDPSARILSLDVRAICFSDPDHPNLAILVDNALSGEAPPFDSEERSYLPLISYLVEESVRQFGSRLDGEVDEAVFTHPSRSCSTEAGNQHKSLSVLDPLGSLNKLAASSRRLGSNATLQDAIVESIELCPLGCVILSQDGEVVYSNQAMLRHLEMTEEELLTSTVFDFDKWIRPEQWMYHWDELKRQKSLHFQTSHLSRNGNEIPVLVWAHYIEIEGVGLNCALTFDNRNKLESDRQLDKSESLRAAMLSAAIDCVITTDSKGTVVVWNHAAERVFGFSQEHAVGSKLSDLIVPEHLRAEHEAALQRLALTGKGNVSGKRIEMPALRASGDEFPIEISIASLRVKNETYFTAYLRDITDQKKFVAEVESARATAEKARDNIESFLLDMSHEIRSPLASIVGQAELLLDECLTPLEVRESHQRIHRNATHLVNLVDKVFAFSAINGKAPLSQKVTVNPSDIVRDVVQGYVQSASSKNLQIHWSAKASTQLEVLLDKTRFEQVLSNLVSNAIKFTQQGCISVNLKVNRDEAATKNVLLHVTVTDTGIGIPTEYAERVFAPMFRIESGKSNAGGQGLGLAIAKRTTELLGGSINYKPNARRGSTFEFCVPCSIAPRTSHIPVTRDLHLNTPSMEATSEDLASEHVLVVDDNEDNRDLVKMMLRGTRFQCTVCASGQEAVAIHRRFQNTPHRLPFSVILMDLRMPKMSGFEAGQQLRKDGFKGQLLAFTADVSDKNWRKCFDEGFNGVIQKPFRRLSLIDALSRKLTIDRVESSQEGCPDLHETDFEILRRNYRSSLVKIFSEMRKLSSRDDVDGLLKHLHQLRGNGSNYGYPVITHLAGNALDEYFKNSTEERETNLIRDLDTLMRAIATIVARES